MTYREVVLSIQGLRDRDKYFHDLLRRATMITSLSGFGGKEIVKRFEKLWPTANEEGKTTSRREIAKQQLKKFRDLDEMNKDIKKVKELLDGRRLEDNSRG